MYQDIVDMIIEKLKNDNFYQIIDFYYKILNPSIGGCPCPYCNYNLCIDLLVWKIPYVQVKAKRYFAIVDEEMIYKIGVKNKLALDDYENWPQWKNRPEIVNALNQMQTKSFALKEQSEESWDKNRAVY